MTDRMRKALELIASGVGPLGARLGYDQMREIAAGAIREADGPHYWVNHCGTKTEIGKGPAIPQNLEARLPGYVAPEMPLPPMMVRDLL